MPAVPNKLTTDALAIWRAAVDAVDSARLVENAIQIDGGEIAISGRKFNVDSLERIIVVGAGKAGAGMARGFERVLASSIVADKLAGWINVPADCVSPLKRIHLHAARPATLNEPTAEGVIGSQKILELVSNAAPNDVVIVLLSGGGSALLPAPRAGITLDDKQIVTRQLMQRGATIHELNTVRKHLSRIKGGGLARASRAQTMISLIISDVIGDPLDVIASGPTVPDSSTPQQAYDVLTRFVPADEIPPNVRRMLQQEIATSATVVSPSPAVDVTNVILGNNAVALHAAAERSESLGYRVVNLGSNQQGIARDVGVELAEKCRNERNRKEPESQPVCLLSGGEPVVHLAKTDEPRKGGRNQELVLAALDYFWSTGCENIVLLSGGTDGEDGPTDAAGAFADQNVWRRAREQNLHPAGYLAINNAYPFFEKTGGLIITGPTHTNVMDVRVCLIA